MICLQEVISIQKLIAFITKTETTVAAFMLVHLLHGGKDLLNGVVLLRSALAQAPSSPCCSDYRLLQRSATGLLRRRTGRESLRRRTGRELRRREARECCRSAEAQRAAQEAGAATARVTRGRGRLAAREAGGLLRVTVAAWLL